MAVWILVPKSKDSTASPLDPVGAVLSIVGISALVYAIIEGPNHGWASAESLLWFTGAIVVLALFAWWEWRSRHPMLDLRLFRNRRFSVASGGISLIFFAMFGMFYLLTQYLQFVLGYSPLEAAVRLLPFPALMMIVAPQTPRLVGPLRCRPGGVDWPRLRSPSPSCSPRSSPPTRRTGTSRSSSASSPRAWRSRCRR